jgi:hypothetical protein
VVIFAAGLGAVNSRFGFMGFFIARGCVGGFLMGGVGVVGTFLFIDFGGGFCCVTGHNFDMGTIFGDMHIFGGEGGVGRMG